MPERHSIFLIGVFLVFINLLSLRVQIANTQPCINNVNGSQLAKMKKTIPDMSLP